MINNIDNIEKIKQILRRKAQESVIDDDPHFFISLLCRNKENKITYDEEAIITISDFYKKIEEYKKKMKKISCTYRIYVEVNPIQKSDLFKKIIENLQQEIALDYNLYNFENLMDKMKKNPVEGLNVKYAHGCSAADYYFFDVDLKNRDTFSKLLSYFPEHLIIETPNGYHCLVDRRSRDFITNKPFGKKRYENFCQEFKNPEYKRNGFILAYFRKSEKNNEVKKK